MQVNRVSLLTIFLIFVSLPVTATENIRLQLKWSHQFQFAGYYAAQKLGYYAEAGLDVDIIEAKTGEDPTKIVLQGDAEYGVGSNSLLLLRNAGEPLVVLAVIFQHSPYVLLTLQQSATQNIHDLVNKNLMIEPLADELIAYLKHEGMPISKFKLVEYRHNIQDFISGKVDAISSYVTDEPYLLEKNNIAYNSYSPRSVGIDFYGDNLFTTEAELKENPERARKFREASLRGWRYAMSHQQEMVDYILSQYPNRKEHDFLLYEAQKMQHLMQPELIDVGYMLSGRWRHIANTYAELGMLPKNISLDGFLYTPNQTKDYFWLYITVAITLAIILIAIMIGARFSKLNKKLIRLLHIKSRFANIGESINNVSHQWKQPLNELGIQLMLIEKSLENDFPTEKDKTNIKMIIHKSYNILEFMSNTVNVFGKVLNRSEKKTRFHPKTVIQALLQLVEDNFKIYKISITSTLDEDILLDGNSTELSHIMLSILNNARDIFRERNISKPNLHIDLYKSETHVYIEITDNAGGIKVKPIKHIFNLGISHRAIDESGIGLYISKQLTKNKFGGEICAENVNSGAVFKISIPYSSDS